jgi:hypothetical protein
MQTTNSRQRRTLERIFAAPTPNDIPWPDIESLLKHIGCTIKHRDGSKITIMKDREKTHVHRPHPQTQTPDWTIKKIKKFIENIGAKP